MITTPDKVKTIKPRKRRRDDQVNARWWKCKDEETARGVEFVVRAIEKSGSTRRSLLAYYAGLYLDVRTGETLLSRIKPKNANLKRIGTNVCQSVVDTAGAHVHKGRPRPIYLTSGGDLKLQQRARKLTKYMDGLFALVKAHVVGQSVARDCRIFGTGIGYFYADPIEETIKIERILVDEMRIDDDEARNGMPLQMHRVRAMSRDELIEIFPEHAQAIEDAQPMKDAPDHADLVEVIESWRLPTGKVRYEKKDGGEDDDRSKPITDGCFATTLGGQVTLQQVPYTKKYFPFLPLYWTEPLAGFWGRGLIEEVAGKQKNINDLDADIRKSLEVSGKVRILVEEGSAVDTDGISDEIGEVIKYSGTPPQFIAPPAVSPEVYQFREKLKQEAYELSGVSMSQAQSKKEPGVTAGVAIREVNDVNATRFVLKAQAYEQWYLDAARICIDLTREMHDVHNVNLKVKGRAGKFIESIQWSDVDLDDDAYDLQVFPASLLPTTPQGRLQTVTEMMDKQIITQEAGKRLIDFPDLEEFNSLENAAFDYAADIVADLLEGGDYTPPDVRGPLQMVKDVALSNYLRALRMKVPEHVMENLRQLMDECQLYLDAVAAGVDVSNTRQWNAYLEGKQAEQAAPPPMDPAAMMGGAPPGMPPMDDPVMLAAMGGAPPQPDPMQAVPPMA